MIALLCFNIRSHVLAQLTAKSMPFILTSMTNSPDSPCIGSCAVSARAGFCIGCGRTLKEIGYWQGMTAPEKRDVLAQLPERLEKLDATLEGETS